MRRLFPPKNSLTPTENNDTSNNYQKRLYIRNKSSSHVSPKSKGKFFDEKTNTRIVRIRLVFIRIGDIDTLNEKYNADVYYESRWIDKINVNIFNLSPPEQSQLLNEKIAVRLTDMKVKPSWWTPELFIENAVGQVGEQKSWFSIKRISASHLEPLSPPVVNLEFCEHHRIKGIFWEKLELNHFPADVQDLTVSITTRHLVENCLLVQDEEIRSSINREAFIDQQEWSLYEHVATEERTSKEEYTFEDEDCGRDQKKHPVLAVTCRAARRPGYYYWNGFCLIFLITICSFCIFSIPPDLPQSRLQITCTLLLTSVTFRWVVNRSLPTISYLTTLDKYAIISIVILVLLCVWHSCIASIAFQNPTVAARAIGPTNIYAQVDRYVFIGMFVFYILIHLLLIIWLILVPYGRRREMQYLDREYAANKRIQLNTVRKRYDSTQTQSRDLVFRRSSSVLSNQSGLKSPVRPMKQAEGVTTIANASIFLPIKEETNESMTEATNPVELHEQDDVFYDNTSDIKRELKNTQTQPIEKC